MLEWIADMIGTLVNGIESIVEGLLSLFDFLFSMIEDLVYVAALLGDIGGGIAAWLSWLPPLVVSTVVVLIALAIVFRVLGRE